MSRLHDMKVGKNLEPSDKELVEIFLHKIDDLSLKESAQDEEALT